MQAVSTYLLQITAAGILSGIVNKLLGSKGMIGSVIKLMTGVFMMLAVVSPLVDIRLDLLKDGYEDIRIHGQYAASEGEDQAKKAMAEIITERTQAYILDKAESLGADIAVEVTVSDAMPPVPCGARISGKVSPYAKRVLSEYMKSELGISMEAQIWTG